MFIWFVVSDINDADSLSLFDSGDSQRFLQTLNFFAFKHFDEKKGSVHDL